MAEWQRAAQKAVKKKIKKASGGTKAVLLVLFLLAAVGIFFFLRSRGEKTPAPAPLPKTEQNALVLHQIDCGQGDAAVAVLPDGKTILIDTGTQASAATVTAYLENLGIEAIDLAVFTHPHEDHIGGARAVLKAFSVREVLLPDAAHDTALYEKLLVAIDEEPDCTPHIVEPGQTYTVGEAKLRILGPIGNDYKNLNNYSIVSKLIFKDVSFLFTGDAETLSEKEILSSPYADELSADVLKVGHHGSSGSTSAAFLTAVSPSYALISVGEGNDYGHPADQTLKRLEKKGVLTYRTDLCGTVRVITDGTGLRVETER